MAAKNSRSISHLSDEELVSRWREEKDQEALHELVTKHTLRLFYYLVGRGFLPEDSEKIVQNTWVEVWIHVGDFEDRGPGSFGSWTQTLARRQARDFLRKRSREKARRPLPEEEQAMLRLLESEDSVEGQALIKKELSEIESRLGSEARIVFEMFMEGYTSEEIARELGRSRPGVYRVWRGVLDVLREAIQEPGKQ